MRFCDRLSNHMSVSVMIFFVAITMASSILAAPHLHLAAPLNYVTGPIPNEVLPTDLDGDGDLDVLVKCSDVLGGPLLQMYENPGDGSLIFHTSLQIPADTELIPADLNGDGLLDMAQVHKVTLTTGELNVYMRNGPFSFAITNFALPYVPDKICPGNFGGTTAVDLVIGDAILPEVHVYFGDGTGAFTFQGTYDRESLSRDIDGDGVPDSQTNFNILDLACADLDGDGDDDIIASNSMDRSSGNAHNIVTLMNLGNGVLGPFQVILDPFGGEVDTGDMDGDGDMDIVTSGVSPTGPDMFDLYLLKNNGDGTFQLHQRFASGTGNHQIGGIMLVDVDQDGDTDVAIIIYGLVPGNPNDNPTDRWALFRNGGTGNLGTPEFFPSGAGILDLVFADLDGINGPEAMTVAGDDDRLTIYYNEGGTYAVPSVIAINDSRATIHGTTATDITSSDYNYDGLKDLAIIANHSRLVDNVPDTLILLDGVAGGISTAPHVIDFSQQVPLRILSKQVAGSLASDIGMIFLGDSLFDNPAGVGLILGTFGGQPGALQFTPLDGAPSDLASLDVNTDGIQDLAVLRERKEGLTAGISILSGANDGSLTYLGDLLLGSDDVLDYDTRLPYVLTTADMNNDTRKDLVSVTWNLLGTKNGIISVILNNGNLNFTLAGEFQTVTREVTDIIAMDVTGDNLPDVILTTVPDMTAPGKDGSLEILPNLGGGILGTAISYNVGNGPVRVAAAQMDTTPGLDLIVANDGSNEVTLLFNNGQGEFPIQERYLSGGGTEALTVADFDQDGDTDVVVCNDEHISYPGERDHYATVTLLKNRRVNIIAGDMDGDGDVDGVDLAIFAQQVANGTNTVTPAIFAANYGRSV